MACILLSMSDANRGTTAVLIYDGDCGFCRSCAAWIAPRLPKGVRTAPYQELDLAELGVSEQAAAAAVLWVEGRGAHWTGHAAVGKALAAAGGCWAPLGRALTTWPVSLPARLGYALVARNRHRLRGRRKTVMRSTDSALAGNAVDEVGGYARLAAKTAAEDP